MTLTRKEVRLSEAEFSDLADQVAVRLRSFTVRTLLRQVAEQYFTVPTALTDAEALRVLAAAIKLVDGEI